MAIKNFFISIIKSLIVLLLATLIFSSATSDFPNLIKGIFGDVFAYSSPEVQKDVVGKLAETCSSLDNENAAPITQICTNQTVLESGEFEKKCRQVQSQPIDMGRIGNSCKEYKSGKINDKEFFLNVIESVLPSQQEAMPKIDALQKYNQVINYLNSNKILYFVILAALIAVLYLLIMNIKLFLLALAGISFSIGILIMLPYFAVLLYDKFIGINTTSILGSMLGSGIGIDSKAIISVVLLLFLRTYTVAILTLGIVLLGVGIFGKVYGFMLKRKLKKKSKNKKS